MATCSSVFGVGLYAHHRWKLRSTSLGLLAIATLLVPLCFLGMAAVWKENLGVGHDCRRPGHAGNLHRASLVALECWFQTDHGCK